MSKIEQTPETALGDEPPSRVSRLTMSIDTTEAEASLKQFRAMAEETANVLSNVEIGAMASLEGSIQRLTDAVRRLNDAVEDATIVHRQTSAKITSAA